MKGGAPDGKSKSKFIMKQYFDGLPEDVDGVEVESHGPGEPVEEHQDSRDQHRLEGQQ